MRGKRWFAALAASALGLGALAVAGAPAAQAAPTVSVYCVGNGTGVDGDPGSLPDPTTVQPNCSITAALSVNGKTSVGATPYLAGATWVRMTISGDSTWDDTNPLWNPATRPTITNSGKTITLPAANLTSVTGAAVFNPATVDDSAIINVPTAGIRTIAVETSSVSSPGVIPPNNQFTAKGEFTVTGLGGTATSLVSQGYYAVSQFANTDDTAALAIVHVVDEAGNVINTAGATFSNLTYNASSGVISLEQYRASDCAPNGVLTRNDEGATANVGIVTDACATTVGAGVAAQANSGVWMVWEGFGFPNTATPGNYTATFTLNMPNGTSYPVSVPYVVSSTVAASWSLAFDKTEYAPGATAVATANLVDSNGLKVPDGVGWTVPGGTNDDTVNRSVRTSSNNVDTRGEWNYAIVSARGGVAYDDSFATYNGANELVILVPAEAMTSYVVSVTPLISGTAAAGNQTPQNGWLTPLQGVAKSVSAKIGNPTPPAQETIMIEGTRGVGDDANRVYVEGTTTSLVGKTVTPYFRFPGETGFTAGTGARTVDAQGNFSWQRKTGKKIAVQFRAGDGVVSNTIIIEAK